MASDGHIIVKAEYEEELQEMEAENIPPTATDTQQGDQGTTPSASHNQTQGNGSTHFRPGTWARGGYRGQRNRGGYRGSRGYRGGNRGGNRGGYRGGRAGYSGPRFGTPPAWNRQQMNTTTPQHGPSHAEFPDLPKSQSNASVTQAVKRPRQFSPETNSDTTNGATASGGAQPNETMINTSDPAPSNGLSA